MSSAVRVMSVRNMGSDRLSSRRVKIRNMERWTVHFSGHVQGVGFRYTTRQLARGFEVSGYVRNLDDGRVELVIEGETRVLEDFLAMLKQQMQDYIHEIQQVCSPALGQFPIRTLTIRH